MLLTAGCFHTNETGTGTSTTTGSRNEPQRQMVRGTLVDLLEIEGERSLECAYSYESETGERIQGVTYVDPVNDRLHSELESTIEGRGEVNAHVLVANQALYVWSEQDPGGIIFPYEGDITNAEPLRNPQYRSEFIQKDVEYACEEKDIEATQWAVPTDVAFANFASLATSTPQTATSTPPRATSTPGSTATSTPVR